MPSSAFQTCALDRKSTRLNSSHTLISYAVFCLTKKSRGSEEHTSELQSQSHLVCRLLLAKTNRRRVPRRRRSRGPARGGDAGARGEAGHRLFFLMIRRPPKPTLFPYPALSR